ncbi:MAG: MBL fold metallo-hydrolase [Lachnospiraceae bacterium]|nr:MBL fold metallo-hydrolase [Lachnospiraceae bacterium]
MNKMNIKMLVLGEVSTNCYLVCNQDTKECIIIDPAAKADVIIKAVEELEVLPKAVLLTHGHYDHIGAAEEIKEHFHIKIYANELEQEVLESSYKNLSEIMGSKTLSVQADEYLTDGQILTIAGFRIRAISTPGHTKGGMCYNVSLEEEQAIFSGDTLFRESVGRFDFPTSDGDALFRSIKEKILCLETELKVYPGHGPATSIGEEKSHFFLD